MLKDLFFSGCFLFCAAGCMSTAAEDRIYHSADLHDELWREDSTAVEQIFTIRVDTITTLKGEKGTKLIIPAHAFVLKEDPDAKLAGQIELRITEVYELAGMFREHLTTQDQHGKPLDSRGMVYLSAYAEGKELDLKEGKKILLGFPQKEGFEKARLFSGKINERTAVEWSLTDSMSSRELRVETISQLSDSRDITQVSAATIQGNDTSWGDKSTRVDSPSSEELMKEALDYAEDKGESGYYYFSTENLQWINCDRYLDDELTEVRLDITAFPANTLYYLVLEDINAIMHGYRKEGEAKESHPVFERVPLGHKAKVIVVYNKEGDYYLGSGDIEISASEAIQLQSEKTEKGKIVNYLKSLGRQQLTASR